MSSKLELNVRNLIAHCEELQKDDTNQWMLKKYVKSLDTMIQELEGSANEQINRKLIDEYHSRCGKIKKAINYIEPSASLTKLTINKQQDGDGDAIIGDTILREIKQIHNNKYTSDIRQELLGGGTTTQSSSLLMGNNKSGLRKRDIQNVTESTSSLLSTAAAAANTTGQGNKDGLGQAVKHYTDMQEKIAEDMLILTRNLKEQTETANRIIRKDTELVTASTKLSDRNYLSLSSESDKLQEHSKRAWKCWMWIMIALVMTIFIFMVLFMKIMKKKVISS